MKTIIPYFLCFIVEAIILLQYASHIFAPKHSFKSRIVVLAIIYLFLFLISLLNIKWLNMGLYILGNFIFFISQYNTNIRLSVFNSALVAAIMGMCELVVYYIIERFTPNFFSNMDYFHNTIIFIICSKTLFFAIICLVTHFMQGSQHDKPYDNLALLLIFIPLTAIFIMLTFLAINDQYTLSSILNLCISLGALFLLVSNLLVFGLNQYIQSKSQNYMDMQLLLQKENASTEYYKMLLSQTENQSILIHDIKKHLQSIHLLSKQNENVKINNYIEQLLKSSSLKESVRICDNELLNAILARFSRQCDECNITFLTDIRSGAVDFINDNDLTSLFCNLLENAVESARNIPNSFIEITTCKRENTPYSLLTVVNSCRTNPYRPGSNSLITTKANKLNHGYGIKSIRKIVEKYQGELQMYYNDETLTFHTVITIK